METKPPRQQANFRLTDEDVRLIAVIRQHLDGENGESTDTGAIRFALRYTAKKLPKKSEKNPN